jgi:hypothetical protein
VPLRLNVPRVLAFTVVLASVPATLSCGDDDAPVADAHSELHCVPNGLALDGGVDAPPCPMYADDSGACPFGCTVVA